jgi:4-alpha-glucanotransferase
VLLHPTSLPGPYGVGDLGPTAHAWIDALARARQTWWQVLPLGPTGYGDSPYQSYSSFAGNLNLLSPELLVQDGLLNRSDLDGVHFPDGHIDFQNVIAFKQHVVDRAWGEFKAGRAAGLRGEFEAFCRREAGWLDDFALFMAVKESRGWASWQDWPAGLRERDPHTLESARRELADAVGKKQFGQFLFRRQWDALRRHAHAAGVKVIGDVPIFVAADSADVWANPKLFLLDERRRPTVVAGVPPDYFSKTGQLWGNPLYDWNEHRRTGYAWWAARLRATLSHVDLVRLDHFRGFVAAWHVPAGEATARNGRWVSGPGADFLSAMRDRLGGLPLIAEDLGEITPDVYALRDRFHLPGMRILQFAFGGASESRFLPHYYEPNTAVYTGTHDNNTTRGWWADVGEHERHFARRYLGRDGSEITWDLIRLAWMSVADYALVPLQDLLDLGPEARMNFPGKSTGNWSWRVTGDQPIRAALDRLGEFTELYARTPPGKDETGK